jgi:hypothetical protein
MNGTPNRRGAHGKRIRIFSYRSTRNVLEGFLPKTMKWNRMVREKEIG